MTSYDFEKAAKNAIISVLDEAIDISQLDIVWFSSSLGYMKCTILGDVMGDKWAEVTYDQCANQINVDIYQKIRSTKIPSNDFNFTA